MEKRAYFPTLCPDSDFLTNDFLKLSLHRSALKCKYNMPEDLVFDLDKPFVIGSDLFDSVCVFFGKTMVPKTTCNTSWRNVKFYYTINRCAAQNTGTLNAGMVWITSQQLVTGRVTSGPLSSATSSPTSRPSYLRHGREAKASRWQS